jgi:NADPH2:quinone reductase
MKAVQISRFGGPEVLEQVDLPVPTPAAGQVLLRVMASGVNFAETLMRQNRYAITPPLPCVFGGEVAGVIEAVGPDVSGWAVGARVAAALFATDFPFGGYAHYVVISADFITEIPDMLPFDAACALMVQGLTALYLVQQANPAGKTVLIQAAAGGVGTFLIQLCKRFGAKTIIATASTQSKRDFARAFGADIAIDYTKVDWPDAVLAQNHNQGPDIIYESVGGDITRQSLSLLAPLGQIVVYGALNIQDFSLGVPELLGLIFKNQSLTGFAFAPLLNPQSLRQGLTQLFDMAIKGELRVHIGATFPLIAAPEAHRALESRTTSGKVVLTP